MHADSRILASCETSCREYNPGIYEPSERSGQCRRASSWRSVPNYAPSWYTPLALPRVISFARSLVRFSELADSRGGTDERNLSLLSFDPPRLPSLSLSLCLSRSLAISLALSLPGSRAEQKYKGEEREECAIVEFHSRTSTCREAPRMKRSTLAKDTFRPTLSRHLSKLRSAGRRHTRNGDGTAHGAREHT